MPSFNPREHNCPWYHLAMAEPQEQENNRNPDGTFKPGVSGNPGGRPIGSVSIVGMIRKCYHFDCLLNRNRGPGIVLIDRFDEKQADAHLAEKFSIGVTGLPHTAQMRLSNIVGLPLRRRRAVTFLQSDRCCPRVLALPR